MSIGFFPEDSIPCRTHIFLILPGTTTLRTLDAYLCVSQVEPRLWTCLVACPHQKRFHPHTMALLNIPGLSSSCFSPCCPWTPMTERLTGTRLTTNAPPEGLSDHLADSTPLTGYDAKFCVEVNREHTPINVTTRKDSFNHENDLTTTVAASEGSDHHAQRIAASGSQQMVASTVPTLLNLGSSSSVWQQTRGQDFIARQFPASSH